VHIAGGATRKGVNMVGQYRQSCEESPEGLDSYLKESRSKEKGDAITRNRKRSK
jgi:hypothetical protein